MQQPLRLTEDVRCWFRKNIQHPQEAKRLNSSSVVCCTIFTIHSCEIICWEHPLMFPITETTYLDLQLKNLTQPSSTNSVQYLDKPQSWLVILQKSGLTKLLTISHSDKPYVCRAPMYILRTSKGAPTTKESPWKPLCSATVVHNNSYTVVTTTECLR